MLIERAAVLTLADGCRLVADIYRPAAPQRVPAALERTPGGLPGAAVDLAAGPAAKPPRPGGRPAPGGPRAHRRGRDPGRPTANLFAAGHRVRLEIAGSNFPRFDINPNCDPRLRAMEHACVARTSVHMGPALPSRLLLQPLRIEQLPVS